MTFKKEIELYLEEIYKLEETFRKVQDLDTLPLSFFSVSIDALNKLKTGVYELESAQLQIMTKHLKESERKLENIETVLKPAEPLILETQVSTVTEPEQPLPPVAILVAEKTSPSAATNGSLGDTIGKKIFAEFSKSLSLNQRFMFQRDLFRGNTEEMNKALVQLDSFLQSDEALHFLNENYSISWESESGIAFWELLDKRFT
ncbi:MAG: hypothetical protein LBT25_13505 [Candidatus Symbiothrix sp.]|jgi:hypothetical protein|nr:hypothetical protein [Candidatus Symbiothrix sp.]